MECSFVQFKTIFTWNIPNLNTHYRTAHLPIISVTESWMHVYKSVRKLNGTLNKTINTKNTLYHTETRRIIKMFNHQRI